MNLRRIFRRTRPAMGWTEANNAAISAEYRARLHEIKVMSAWNLDPDEHEADLGDESDDDCWHEDDRGKFAVIEGGDDADDDCDGADGEYDDGEDGSEGEH